jgi:hypothetical protein
MEEAPEQDHLTWGGLPSPAILRAGIGLLLGAVASILGAFILGEYQFEGYVPVVGGLLFGLVVAEIVVEVGRRRTLVVGALAGLEAAGGLVWAGWISGGEGLGPIPSGAWLAAGLAVVAAVARTWDRRRSTPAATADQPAGPS